MNIKRGSIIFTTTRSWISKRIMDFDQEYSHILISATNTVDEHTFTLEADQFGVQGNDFESRLKKVKKFEIFEIQIPEEEIRKAVDSMFQYIGKSYGYLQLLGFMPVILLRKLGIKIKNPFSKGLVCSEFVLKYLKRLPAVRDLFAGLDSNTCSPQDILTIIRLRSDIFKKVA